MSRTGNDMTDWAYGHDGRGGILVVRRSRAVNPDATPPSPN